MGTSLEQSDGVIARWVAGDLPGSAALAALCTLVARCDVQCGVVYPQHGGGVASVIMGEGENPAPRQRIEHIARVTSPWRAFHTRGDDRWPHLLGEDDASAAASWLASEPLEIPTSEEPAALVVIGACDAHRDAILGKLPALARACAAIVALERSVVEARERMHAVKNLLAIVTANVEYATFLTGGSEASAPEQSDAAQALDKALEAAKQVVPTVDALLPLVARRGPP